MKRSHALITVIALVATVTETTAFSPAFVRHARVPTRVHSSLVMESMVEAPAQQQVSNPAETSGPIDSSPPSIQKQPSKRAPKSQHSQTGIFSPLVILAKDVLGEDQLNKVRAKAISLHSDVISNFVDTSNTGFGLAVLTAMFYLVDTNHSGTIDETELASALSVLGFEWLKDKQVRGIFDRADADHDGSIDLQEWIREAPKTLRTNLIKLAKKNGGELGFLA